MFDLPNELLVRIGASVAKLFDLRDYISLSMVSKRWKHLLVDSKTTVAEIIRIRLLRLRSNEDGVVAIRTLQQLNVYETIRKQPFCVAENRVHFDFADLNVEDKASIDLIENVRTILKTHKTVSVILEAHCGTPAPAEIAWEYSHYRGRVVSAAIVRGTKCLPFPLSQTDNDELLAIYDSDNLLDRIHIRAWGKMITQAASQSKHPYGELARKGRGWVEIFLRLDDPENGETILELPSRPEFYNNTRRPTTHLEEPRFQEIIDGFTVDADVHRRR